MRRAIGSSVAPWSARSAAVTSAILIGDRAGLEDEVERKLQEAGTYHVIAISGGNIAILAGLCLLVLRAARIGSRLSALLVILMLGAYALVVEGGSSVGRATLMAAIYFAAKVWDQETRAANVAALAAAMLLCLRASANRGRRIRAHVWRHAWHPHRARRESRGCSRCQAGLNLSLRSSPLQLCAEIALLPIGALVFSRVTFAGLLVNFAAIPLMTVVQIAGMVVIALASWAPEAARWAGWVAHLAVEGLIGSAGLVDIGSLADTSPCTAVALDCGGLLRVRWFMAFGSRRLTFAIAAVGLRHLDCRHADGDADSRRATSCG